MQTPPQSSSSVFDDQILNQPPVATRNTNIYLKPHQRHNPTTTVRGVVIHRRGFSTSRLEVPTFSRKNGRPSKLEIRTREFMAKLPKHVFADYYKVPAMPIEELPLMVPIITVSLPSSTTLSSTTTSISDNTLQGQQHVNISNSELPHGQALKYSTATSASDSTQSQQHNNDIQVPELATPTVDEGSSEMSDTNTDTIKKWLKIKLKAPAIKRKTGKHQMKNQSPVTMVRVKKSGLKKITQTVSKKQEINITHANTQNSNSPVPLCYTISDSDSDVEIIENSRQETINFNTTELYECIESRIDGPGQQNANNLLEDSNEIVDSQSEVSNTGDSTNTSQLSTHEDDDQEMPLLVNTEDTDMVQLVSVKDTDVVNKMPPLVGDVDEMPLLVSAENTEVLSEVPLLVSAIVNEMPPLVSDEDTEVVNEIPPSVSDVVDEIPPLVGAIVNEVTPLVGTVVNEIPPSVCTTVNEMPPSISTVVNEMPPLGSAVIVEMSSVSTVVTQMPPSISTISDVYNPNPDQLIKECYQLSYTPSAQLIDLSPTTYTMVANNPQTNQLQNYLSPPTVIPTPFATTNTTAFPATNSISDGNSITVINQPNTTQEFPLLVNYIEDAVDGRTTVVNFAPNSTLNLVHQSFSVNSTHNSHSYHSPLVYTNDTDHNHPLFLQVPSEIEKYSSTTYQMQSLPSQSFNPASLTEFSNQVVGIGQSGVHNAQHQVNYSEPPIAYNTYVVNQQYPNNGFPYTNMYTFTN